MINFTCDQCGKTYELKHERKRVFCACGGVSFTPNAIKQAQEIAALPRRDKCRHRGAVLRDVPCGCAGKPKVFECALHGECIVKKINHSAAEGFKCCQNCTEWEPVG